MLLNYILPLLSLFSFPLTTASQPQTPNLSYLYTAYVQCAGNQLEDPGPSGPAGMRKTIPIVGGNFTGPRLSGTAPPYKPFNKKHRLTKVKVKSSTSAQTGAPQTPQRIFSPPTRGITSGRTMGRISLYGRRGRSRRRDSCI